VIGPSGIAPLAQRQLAAWQQVAMGWPLVIAERETTAEHPRLAGVIQLHLTCQHCEASVAVLHDGAAGYLLTPQLILDCTVNHLRRRHADQEPSGL
jgi:hypothetical protein